MASVRRVGRTRSATRWITRRSRRLGLAAGTYGRIRPVMVRSRCRPFRQPTRSRIRPSTRCLWTRPRRPASPQLLPCGVTRQRGMVPWDRPTPSPSPLPAARGGWRAGTTSAHPIGNWARWGRTRAPARTAGTGSVPHRPCLRRCPNRTVDRASVTRAGARRPLSPQERAPRRRRRPLTPTPAARPCPSVLFR